MAGKDDDGLYSDILEDVFSALTVEDEGELSRSDALTWCDDVNYMPSPCKNLQRHPNSPVQKPVTEEFHSKRPADCDAAQSNAKRYKRSISNCRRLLKMSERQPDIIWNPEELETSEEELAFPLGLQELNIASLCENQGASNENMLNEPLPEVGVLRKKHLAETDFKVGGSAKKFKQGPRVRDNITKNLVSCTKPQKGIAYLLEPQATCIPSCSGTRTRSPCRKFKKDASDCESPLKQKRKREVLSDVTESHVYSLVPQRRLPCILEHQELCIPSYIENPYDENAREFIEKVKKETCICKELLGESKIEESANKKSKQSGSHWDLSIEWLFDESTVSSSSEIIECKSENDLFNELLLDCGNICENKSHFLDSDDDSSAEWERDKKTKTKHGRLALEMTKGVDDTKSVNPTQVFDTWTLEEMPTTSKCVLKEEKDSPDRF